MSIFDHHIYEYKKGVRSLILHTAPCGLTDEIERKLYRNRIPYLVRRVDHSKVNVFFGEESCIEVVRRFGCKGLDRLTDEEDFILGIMLGYDQLQQCRRYLGRKQKRGGSRSGKDILPIEKD